VQVSPSLVATNTQLIALEQSFRAALHCAWRELGHQGPMPLMLETPAAFASPQQGGLVTVALHIVLPSEAAQQIRSTALSRAGGVFMQVPGTAGLTLAHIHDLQMGPLYLFTLTTASRRYSTANLVQYMSQESGRFAGMRVLWLGATGLRGGGQVLSRFSADGQPLPDFPVPHASSLPPRTVLGLAVGGQRVFSERITVTYLGIGAECFVLRRLPNRARALGPQGPAPPQASQQAQAPQPAQPPQVPQDAPAGSAHAPVRAPPPAGQPEAPPQSMPPPPPPSSSGPAQAAQPPPPSPCRGGAQPCANTPVGGAPLPTSQPPPPRHNPPHSSAPQTSAPVGPASQSPAPASATAAAVATPKSRTLPLTPPAIGQWLWLKCTSPTSHNQPEMVLVATHVWDKHKRLYFPRVLFSDGAYHDLGAADWSTAHQIHSSSISVPVRVKMALAILHSPTLIPAGCAVPDWAACGITFPQGAVPPQGARGRPVRGARDTVMSSAREDTVMRSAPATSPTDPGKVSRPRGQQLGVNHPRSKKQHKAKGAPSTTSSGSYGERGSLNGEAYDRFINCDECEHREPEEPPFSVDVDMLAGTNVQATGPRAGQRPRNQ
jgi:hypothetical protein